MQQRLIVKDWQTKRRLHMKIEAPNLFESAAQNCAVARLKRHDERERGWREIRFLKHRVDADPVIGQYGSDLSQDSRLVFHHETQIVRNRELSGYLRRVFHFRCNT